MCARWISQVFRIAPKQTCLMVKILFRNSSWKQWMSHLNSGDIIQWSTEEWNLLITEANWTEPKAAKWLQESAIESEPSVSDTVPGNEPDSWLSFTTVMLTMQSFATNFIEWCFCRNFWTSKFFCWHYHNRSVKVAMLWWMVCAGWAQFSNWKKLEFSEIFLSH